MLKKRVVLFFALLNLILVTVSPGAEAGTRVTILVDAFGKPSSLARDWGFSALVETAGKRILFDTGNDSDHFAANARKLKIDLARLDYVVISHRHGDHTDGLRHLLKVNPRVKIYVPTDEYFGGPTPAVFFRDPEPSLPPEMRYFGGRLPANAPHGTPWKDARFVRVDSALDLAPGIRLVQNISKGPNFSETPELSLTIATPEGQIVIVGCSIRASSRSWPRSAPRKNRSACWWVASTWSPRPARRSIASRRP